MTAPLTPSGVTVPPAPVTPSVDPGPDRREPGVPPAGACVPFHRPRPGARYPRLRIPAATAGDRRGPPPATRRRSSVLPPRLARGMHGMLVACGLLLVVAATALGEGPPVRGPFAGPALPAVGDRPVPMPP